jgi:hypothetical protein
MLTIHNLRERYKHAMLSFCRSQFLQFSHAIAPLLIRYENQEEMALGIHIWSVAVLVSQKPTQATVRKKPHQLGIKAILIHRKK